MNNKFELVKNFQKIWSLKKIDGTEDAIPVEEYVGYMDPANVMMIIPKLKSVKEIIQNSFDVEESKVPKLSYKVVITERSLDNCMVVARLGGEKPGLTENSVKLSAGYMKVILSLCTKTKSESIVFKFSKDYPLWVESEEMIIILAPRVEA